MKIKIVQTVDLTGSLKDLDANIKYLIDSSKIISRMGWNKQDEESVRKTNLNDAGWLKKFKKAILKKDLKLAGKIARDMDTSVREYIPDQIYNLLP